MISLDNSFTLLPPLVAIGVAIWRKNAILALIVGVILTWLMNAGLNPIAGGKDTIVGLLSVLGSGYNQQIIIFSLLVGALLVLMSESGGVNAFIEFLAKKRLVNNTRRANMLPVLIGTSIFTETNLSMFAAGIASQSLFDKFKLSRARLAYILDSTCSPISILLLINGWGAYILGLLDGYDIEDTVGVLVDTIVYNFYPIIVLAMVYYTALSTKVYGTLRSTELQSKFLNQEQSAEGFKASKARYMVIPLLTITAATIVLLFYTGNGDIRAGNGAFSVMWAVILSWLILISMLMIDKVLTIQQIIILSVKGMRQLLPAVIVVVLSFAFGDAVTAYGTGTYVSSVLATDFPQALMAPMLFLVAGAMAFATGTSWGTFAILIPIAVPLAGATDLPVAFLVAAVLGGGVFGDHSSPISDSTIIASLASGCDLIEHVRTQLPYNLVAAGMSLIAYLLVGLVVF